MVVAPSLSVTPVVVPLVFASEVVSPTVSEAVVDGKYSTKVYLNTLEEAWEDYTSRSKRTFVDHQRFCYHIPFTRMAQKAHERLLRHVHAEENTFETQVEKGLLYARKMGNAYTAALYIGLISLLENDQEDLSDARIGFFSYGSGCVGEFFSAKVNKGYKNHLHTQAHTDLFEKRVMLSYEQYSEFFSYQLPTDGSEANTPRQTNGRFKLLGIKNHERLYGE